ncbi:MAG: four helix bundle protein [Patescibacteria group bacterium]
MAAPSNPSSELRMPKSDYTPGYKSLHVYQESHKLVIKIYQITASFPKEEIFGLTSQIRRAAVSIPANIIEGWARQTVKEQIQFLYIARGSLTEVCYYLELCQTLGYIDSAREVELKSQTDSIGKLIHGFIRGLKNDN